jgi:CheY-like chemotaxis protein
MPAPARIFIADIQDGQNSLSRALNGYKHFTTSNSSEASRMLSADEFDMIICGIHFDDSRMVELLQSIYKDVRHKQTPVIVFRATHSDNVDMLRFTEEGLRKFTVLGAYIELEDYLNEPDPDQALRQQIENSLPQKLLANRQDSR